MTTTTLEKIKAYGHGPYKRDVLDALLDFSSKTSLLKISEEQASTFLHKLEIGEIKINEIKLKQTNEPYIERALEDIHIVKDALQDYAQITPRSLKKVMEAFQRLSDEVHRSCEEKQAKKFETNHIIDEDMSNALKGLINEAMKDHITDTTIAAIKAYSTDENKGNSLEAFMSEYGVSRLADVTEEQGQEFLEKLEKGEYYV